MKYPPSFYSIVPVRRLIRLAYRMVFGRPYPDFATVLEKAVGDCKTLLDLGCGFSSPVKSFSKKLFCAGVDIHVPSVESSKAEKIHDEYYAMDIMDIEKNFEDGSFDCVLATDVIEHFEKEDGIRLMEMMEKIAVKRVVIFTPNGFLKQDEYDNNPRQVHKSGWSVKEMRDKGYKVTGFNGWKPLRTEHAILIRPRIFWAVVSAVTQIFLRDSPEKAFQIMCVKELR